MKAPIDNLGLSNGARTGLTGFVAGLARKTVAAQRHHQQPAAGRDGHRPPALDTPMLRQGRATSRSSRSRAERAAAIPAGRFGTAEEFGAACAFLCSQQASYVTGQNFLIDGGAYPGTF